MTHHQQVLSENFQNKVQTQTEYICSYAWYSYAW